MHELPYELELALGKIINHENSYQCEIQDIIFLLYEHEKLTWEEIDEKKRYPSTRKGDLREAINGLWVVGFLEMSEDDQMIKSYELTTFGRRLLKNLLNALFIVKEEQS